MTCHNHYSIRRMALERISSRTLCFFYAFCCMISIETQHVSLLNGTLGACEENVTGGIWQHSAGISTQDIKSFISILYKPVQLPSLTSSTYKLYESLDSKPKGI